MKPVAQYLSASMSVIEPFQTARTVQGQVDELKEILCLIPVPTLIGYSWGAMLAVLVASQNPEMFKKIILIGCPPLGPKYAKMTSDTRWSRLSATEQEKTSEIEQELSAAENDGKIVLFSKLNKLFDKTDNFKSEDTESSIDFSLDIYESVWPEAAKMRQEGGFLECLKDIECPVTFIHGDYDPHPLAAVEEAAALLENSRIIVLKNCGHTPWIEKEARQAFYSILAKEIG